MRDYIGIIASFLLGVCVGVTQYYLGDGMLNQAARAAGIRQTQAQQAQVDMLSKMCPEVLTKAQSQEKK